MSIDNQMQDIITQKRSELKYIFGYKFTSGFASFPCLPSAQIGFACIKRRARGSA